MTNQNPNWQSLVNQPFENSALQNDPSITFIDSQAVLEIKGPDAVKFLQGQCTADIEHLEEGNSISGSICTVKGRVLTTFIVTKIGDQILLRMPAELTSDIKAYLAKYAAFYKVEIIEWSNPCVIETQEYKPKSNLIEVTYSLNEQEFTEYLIEERNLDLLLKELQELDLEKIRFYSETVWQNRQIDSGWLNLTTNTTEEFLPHQLNLEKLDAISFKKGCYTGQEIIARTEYRGKPKRRLHRITIKGLNNLKSIKLPIDILDKETEKRTGTLLALGTNASYSLAILPVENDGQLNSIVDGQNCEIHSSKDINVF